MTGSPAVLFLDVDGPLIPFGGRNHPVFQAKTANPLLRRLDPSHGPRLAALPYSLIWATTWMDDANDAIAPVLGLPRLPFVAWPESPFDDEDERAGLHWKTRALVEWAAGRSFAWVDDELTATDQAWVAEHHAGRALLHRVDHRLGLTDADYALLADWPQ
ncbi:HAD domain-containing protein [Amycolatopsis sp. cg5]|uniref:HAD domain-containing protein n=1 Tax=Amycolatopsis sp. cg5 TaxID=3238802 RepID=UPI003523A350